MKPYQERVKNEQLELKDKIDKLTAFRNCDIHRSLHIYDQKLLSEQLRYMNSYNLVLLERMERFT